MASYRIYFHSDGQIVRIDEFDAADDAEAEAIARDRAGDHRLELWSDNRLVRTYPRTT